MLSRALERQLQDPCSRQGREWLVSECIGTLGAGQRRAVETSQCDTTTPNQPLNSTTVERTYSRLRTSFRKIKKTISISLRKQNRKQCHLKSDPSILGHRFISNLHFLEVKLNQAHSERKKSKKLFQKFLTF